MSFNIPLGGLQAAQKRLEVAGNNIANVGTIGYKSSRAEFAAVYASSHLGGGQATGDGVRLANVSQDFSSGAAISTAGRPLDMRIQGNGFFVLSDNGVINYSRAGAFVRDNQGYVVDGDGHRLQGNTVNAQGDVIRGIRSDLYIDTGDMAPKATSMIKETINLNAAQSARSSVPLFNPADTSTYTKVIARKIMDNGVAAVPEVTRPGANGVPQLVAAAKPAIAPVEHELKQYFVKTDDNRWLMHTLIDGRNPADPQRITPLTATITRNADGSVSLLGDGKRMGTRFKPELTLEGWQPAAQVNGSWVAAATPAVRSLAMPLVEGDKNAMEPSDEIHSGSPAFDPANPASYSRLLSSKVVDGEGVEHELQNYFTHVGSGQWALRTLIDGRNPVDPASSEPLTVTVSHHPGNQMLLAGDIAHVKKTTAREFTVDGWKPAMEVNHTWVAGPAAGAAVIPLELNDGAILGVDDGDPVISRMVRTFNPAHTDSYNETFSSDIYDGQGNRHQLSHYFVKDGVNSWNLHMLVNGRNPLDPERTDPMTASMLFDSDGSLRTLLASDGMLVEDKKLTLHGWIPAKVDNPGSQNQKWVANGAQASADGLTIDLTRLTQYNNKNNRASPQVDGYAAGSLNGLKVDDDGMLRAAFSNGLYRNVGQVLLANFANVQGLQPLDGTRWRETYASGAATTDTPKSGMLGGVVAGSLEGSNVDLPGQLIELIQAQMAFQANSKAVSTEATVIQTLLQSV
ncbi:flagellar hook-basal body protein [Pseudomonas sp. JUb42]|uniref:flagellar hook-basal body complex protein n=1 Tax=Pseudomonas sp. JUb42 TaxID=2940611 RepID=UPI002167490F|nr:flagellar hook-basal body complex protein [Pseudomonas sp. JUb42]MCS3470366.1 flagellar hook-basal body protein [Pseudomonas sp. JUb42]